MRESQLCCVTGKCFAGARPASDGVNRRRPTGTQETPHVSWMVSPAVCLEAAARRARTTSWASFVSVGAVGVCQGCCRWSMDG
jgi:hypothetical protein